MKTIRRTEVSSTEEQLVIENKKGLRVGKAERHTLPSAGENSVLQTLLERYVEIFHPILNSSDWKTFQQLRLVSKKIYKQSIEMMNGLSPLMCKAFFKFHIYELIFTVKPKQIQAPEPGQSTEPKIEYTDNEIYKNIGITDFEKTQASFSITFKNNIELIAFSTLIQSDKLSPQQKAILSKIKTIDFPVVKASNITDVNAVLNYFGTQERAGQLTKLSFGYIDAALTLPQLPNLTSLFFGYINATLTLPQLPNLTRLSFGSINVALTLPQLPNLTSLSFGNIFVTLTLPQLPNLTSLSFESIYRALILPQLPNLTSLAFGDIRATLTLPQLPNLTSLSFGDILAALTLPQLPNLTSLAFGDIRAFLTLPQLPNLTNLSFGNICYVLTMPYQPNLKTVLYEKIKDGLTLPEQLQKTKCSSLCNESYLKL